MRDGVVPLSSSRCIGTTLNVVEGRFVGGDESGERGKLCCHVAQGKSCIHRHGFNHWACKFQGAVLTAGRSEATDQMQDQVFCADCLWKFSFENHAHLRWLG